MKRLTIVDAEEVPRQIQHRAPPDEAGLVADSARGQGPGARLGCAAPRWRPAAAGGWSAGRGRRPRGAARPGPRLGRDPQLVALVAQRGIASLGGEEDVPGGGGAAGGGDRQRKAGGGFQAIGQVSAERHHLGAGRLDDDAGRARQAEGARQGGHARRPGDDCVERHGGHGLLGRANGIRRRRQRERPRRWVPARRRRWCPSRAAPGPCRADAHRAAWPAGEAALNRRRRARTRTARRSR